MAKRKPTLPLAKRLVLNRYMLSLFGVKVFEKLSLSINRMDDEESTEERISKFHEAIVEALPEGAALKKEALQTYGHNIASHTQAIERKRPEPIRWKYFQYLALLFTEIYLDRYMNDNQRFLNNLNAYRRSFNKEIGVVNHVDLFTEDDLRKVAFWSATGSGKTLIMHMNIKQYQHYMTQSGRLHELNRILLVTPNEGLSKQHLEEFEISEIRADLFSKQSSNLFTGSTVEIIEITKLSKTDGAETVALESFENKNLVLVDEGHRGSSGTVWSTHRRMLAEKGFTFEYSATLGQAASGNEPLAQEYAKSILFDYSYRYFYNDGFGKDYRILNLADDSQEDTRELYLTACLLAFYQQKILFRDPQSQVRRFNIENPLWIFVGRSVNAIRTENRRKVSDIVDILLFLAEFTSSTNKGQVIQRIEKAISADTGLRNVKGQDIFAGMFCHLVNHTKTVTQLYDGILKDVFHAESNAALHVERLKGTDGEIALRLGDNAPFGVINVGDVNELCNLCKKHEILKVTEKNFTDSLFHSINKEHSTINILIGSKKFSEGWNSWRVSTMGLMNVGRSEGSQVIQLFGRGVRLKGYNNTLKRHSALQEEITDNQRLKKLETLNIFGIRADYMAQFKTYLEEQDIKTENDFEKITIPINKNLKKQKLKIIRLQKGLDYKRDGEKPVLRLCDDVNQVTLDYYPRIQAQISEKSHEDSDPPKKNTGFLSPEHIEFLDMDAIYFDLQTFKNERRWFNMNIKKENLYCIISDDSWYELFIPKEQLEFDDFKKLNVWQSIATDLLRKYCDRYYKICKDKWETGNREYRNISLSDPNFIPEYRVLINKSEQQIINQIKEINEEVKKTKNPKSDKSFGQNKALFFDQHLYEPLLYSSSKDIHIKPDVLNDGEKKFVQHLRKFYNENPSYFKKKEIYLLRNIGKGKGIGFFEVGNFYPDFLLWLLDGKKQYISFIDPKGLLNIGLNNPKMNFYKTIKKIENDLGDKNVILNSFIVSVTTYNKIKKMHGDISKEYLKQRHILLQKDQNYIKQLFTLIQAKKHK